MADKKVMLTEEGYNKLVDKVNYLKSVRRIEIAERLKAAIALGDLSENSEYDDAKNEQAFLEGEIQESRQRSATPISSRLVLVMWSRWAPKSRLSTRNLRKMVRLRS